MKNNLPPIKFTYIIQIIYFLFSSSCAFSQRLNDARPLYHYYYDYKLANPAFTGFEDKLRVMSMYSGVPMNSSLDLYKYYFSGEVKLDAIKSAVGGLLKINRNNTLSQKGAALFYRYKFDVSAKSNLHAGLQLSYDRYRIHPYHSIDIQDPIIDNDRNTTDHINLDMGLVYHTPYLTIGGAVKNILKQKILRDSSAKNYSALNLIVTRKFIMGKSLVLTPSLFFQSRNMYSDEVAFNITADIAKWFIVGGGYVTYLDSSSDGNFTVNGGVNIKDYVQVVMHAYSSLNQKNDFYSGKNSIVEMMVRFRLVDKTSSE